MPGVVEKLMVSDKQEVASGDVLCIISALKMEVNVTANTSGIVSKLAVKAGARLVEGALLMSIQPK